MIFAPRGSRVTGTAFKDFLFLCVLGFIAMVIWLLPHINPPHKEDAADPPGNFLINVYWPPGCNSDIDTWVFGLGEPRPVGYSNRSGKVWNLLRDDLGSPDNDRNFENVYSRGIMAGEIIVNLHVYRVPTECLPLSVDVEVGLNTGQPGKGSIKKLVTTTVKLHKTGDEKTAIRFRVNAEGAIIAGTTNNVFRPLRAATPGM
jgi:hypothetical protein